MEKPAVAEYPIQELLARRWSPTTFGRRSVAPETLRSLLEAARWAASSFNEQPWNSIVAPKEDVAGHRKLVECLVPANAAWAQHAPVLMLVVARMSFSRNGKPNRHAFYDCGAASASLTMQATSLGLYVHQMAGIDAAKARERFAIPEGYEPVAAMALGYAAEQIPGSGRDAEPRTRRPQREWVFGGNWGSASPLV